MRVLFLTDSLSDLDGVGRYAVRLIAALERLEPSFEPRVLLARKHRPTSAAVPAHWRIEVGLPPDYFFHMSPPRFWPSLAAAAWRVRGAARGCELVHAIKDYPHNFAGALGAKLAGVPCIATAHGTYSVQPLLEPRHRPHALWTYRRLAALISVSRFTARRLDELLPPDFARERLAVIPNAVDAEHYRTQRALAPARAWHGVPFTLSIGELKERKGHHLALEAWMRVAPGHPDLHHFVVGKGGGDAYEARLRALAASAGGRVHFLGNVAEEEKVDLLQRARLFLHTPVTAAGGGFEGFGIVYLEAAASGTPSIGTLGSGAEDAIADGASGLLVEPDVESVAEALGRLLGDDALRERMAATAREHARRSSWDENARAVLALYRAALASPRGRAEAAAPGGGARP